jgi:hypothetical protein
MFKANPSFNILTTSTMLFVSKAFMHAFMHAFIRAGQLVGRFVFAFELMYG